MNEDREHLLQYLALLSEGLSGIIITTIKSVHLKHTNIKNSGQLKERNEQRTEDFILPGFILTEILIISINHKYKF